MSSLAAQPACKPSSSNSQEIRPIVSPIHRLPTELLVKIFVHCIHPQTAMFILSSDAPLLLAQICSHWRTVALGTPCLWRSISHFSVNKWGRWQRYGSLAKLFLSRSAGCPLSIRLWLIWPTYTNDHPILDALIPHADRWEDISLGIQVSWCRSLEPLVGKLSQLRKLYLHRTIDNATQLEPIRCFQTAPNLREVDISFDHRSLFLPWSQLTHCTLSCLNISSCAEIIRLASSLIHCMLDSCQHDSEAPRRPVDSQLVSLHVREVLGGWE